MTALGKLFRTTAFKLSLAYLVVFAIGAGLVLGRVAWNVKGLMDEQIGTTIEAEIKGLAEQYTAGGIRRLVFVIEQRIRQPGASLYLVTSFNGQTIAGNVVELQPGALDRPGLIETTYRRTGDTDARDHEHRALARIFVLPGGFRLMVGRDLGDRETLRNVMARALFTSLAWLVLIGTLGGLFVARRVLHRVDVIGESAGRIMKGDLTQRIPVSGSNDELDRLALNLNAMLERIAELMTGLKEVSDNIAHDLKTPLTRLRNGAEEALRTARDPDDYRAALERMIEESDGLIRIFNALLTIARLEAGQSGADMTPFDIADVTRDVGELYEPLAEEQGAGLELDAQSGLRVIGNRELIGQATANLIDNALKYGVGDGGGPAQVSVAARRVGANAEIIIADRGPGVSVEDRSRVLDRFVRLEGARSRPGSGLGLSMAAAIAKLHGGQLRIEDNEPGLRVVLAMPLQEEPREQKSPVLSLPVAPNPRIAS
ncbi:MAG: integral rane sensor signal transduction histidine kinase [Hyphomicrobiales bacterium]|nr:integral rane sensor signal transduction histidine kinase [Hyphomicrobiales bacterium]